MDAGRVEGPRDGGPDAAACTGDQGDPPFERLHLGILLRDGDSRPQQKLDTDDRL
jgi:hypothetical protein